MPLSENLLSTALKKEEITPIQRFRFESLLTEKHGRDGLRVYFMVNGTNTVRQILAQTGLDDRKMIEIIKLMAENGLLKIELSLLVDAPAAQKAAAPAAPKYAAPPAEAAPAAPKYSTPPSSAPASSTSAPPAVGARAPMPSLRSPIERKMYEKFGTKGVDAYRLMDTVGTPEEILKKMPITEEELIAILEFMQAEGIVELETPEAKQAAKPVPKKAEAVAPSAPAVLGTGAPTVPKQEAAPRYETQYAPAKPAEAPKPVVKLPVRQPRRKSIGLFGKLKLEAELLRMFGQKGVHLFSLIDGDKADIELSKETRYPLSLIDRILEMLAKEGWIELHELNNEEVREHYGEEGIEIGKEYGRDGVFIYELIDKKASVKDIIVFSEIDPRRGVEIFGYIHKILGIDIPMDRVALYKQLGVEM